MEIDQLFTEAKTLVASHKIPVFFGIVGLTLFGYGLIQILNVSQPQKEIQFQQAKAVKSPQNPVKNIFVDVEGEVAHPGVFGVSQDARVQDALIQAGGLSANADRDWVEKHINLAAKITDGGKLYIPRVGEQQSIQTEQSPGTQATEILGVQTGLININNASASELDALPGIGMVTAQKIIDGRPYTAIDDLISKKIVKQSVFSKIKDKISIY